MTLVPLGFLTLRDRTGYCIYDALAVPPLNALGYSVVEVPWDESHDWSQFAAVIIRSPWDYTERLSEFLETLDAISGKTLLLNGLDVVRWNSNKGYLQEIEQAGVPIVPTIFGERLDEAALAKGFSEFGCDELVVKPLVSANARGTFRLPRSGDMGDALAHHARGDYLLQPFVNSVLSEGEVSLFYFGGEFSHAVCKTPKAGDFRVQEEHGGILRRVDASPELLEAAARALAAVPFSLLYARVDLVSPDSGWRVMELELIEPSLYFPLDAESPCRFASAVHRRLTSERQA